jgi:hypothetical protein
MLQIFIEDHWGMRVEYRVTPSDPVQKLKLMIEEIDGKLIGVYAVFMWEDPSTHYLGG